MLNRLLGATAIGVVFTTGLSVTLPSAQAQVANPDNTCRDGEDELGNTIGTALRCGTSARATQANATALGSSAKADAEASTAVGRLAKVESTARGSIAIGFRAEVNEGDDDPATTDVDESISSDSIAIGRRTRITGANSTSVGADSRINASNATAVGAKSRIDASNAIAVGVNAIVEAGNIESIAIRYET